MIQYITAFIFFLSFAFFEGKREAYYYHEAEKTGGSTISNIHWIYFIQRGLVLLIICFLLPWELLFKINFFIACLGCFSFIHDGSYYLQRNKLNRNIYLGKWKSGSTTSTAFFEFGYTERTLFFGAGIILFIFNLLLWGWKS